MSDATVAARPRGLVIACGIAAAAVVATALDAAVAAIAHAAGASSEFQALRLPTYAALTVIGILAGAAGWALVRARAANPRRVLGVLVPAVVLVSFTPDVLVGASGELPGTSWGAVAALMVMHVVVAVVAVATYLRVLPLPENRS